MRAHTPYNPQVCARFGAPRTYYRLSSNSHDLDEAVPLANYDMVHDHHADAASAVAALIVLILLMIQQAFLISSPNCLPMIDAMIMSMVIPMNVAPTIVVIIPIVVKRTTLANLNIKSS